MHHQQRFCCYKGKKKAEIADCLCKHCSFWIFDVRSPVFVLFFKYFLENVEKKFLVGSNFREYCLGNSKHNKFFFSPEFGKSGFFLVRKASYAFFDIFLSTKILPVSGVYGRK